MNNPNKPIFSRPKLYLFFFFLILAASLNFFSSYLISRYFPVRPVPEDLLFKLIPPLPVAGVWTDVAAFFSVALLLWYLFSENISDLGATIYSYALAYTLRAAMIVLTPLGNINGGDGSFYGQSHLRQLGAFPSGHTLIVCLSFLILSESKNRSYRLLGLASLTIEIVALILSRGHYSIDIVGGCLLAYFVYQQIKPKRLKFKI